MGNSVPFSKYPEEEFLELLKQDKQNPRTWQAPEEVVRNLERTVAIKESKPSWRRVTFSTEQFQERRKKANRAASQAKAARKAIEKLRAAS